MTRCLSIASLYIIQMHCKIKCRNLEISKTECKTNTMGKYQYNF